MNVTKKLKQSDQFDFLQKEAQFMTKLYFLAESDKGQPFDLKGDTVPIGRSSDNRIRLKDTYISRKHLKILGKREKCFIENFQESFGCMAISSFQRTLNVLEIVNAG